MHKTNRWRRWIDSRFQGSVLRFILWLSVLLAVAFFCLKESVFRPRIWDYLGNDFPVFFQASRDLWTGRPIYHAAETRSEDEAEFDRREFWGGYVYPAFFAAHLGFLLWLPVFWAKKAYGVLCMAAYALLFADLVRRCRPRPGPWPFAALFALWFSWAPSIDTFRIGQTNALVLFFLFLAWLAAEKGQASIANGPPAREKDGATGQGWRILAGALLGLACVIKLTPLAIIPLLLLRKERKVAVSAAGAFLAALVFVFPTTNWYYFTRLLPALPKFTTFLDQPSVHMILMYRAVKHGLLPMTSEAVIGSHIPLAISFVVYLGALVVALRKGRNWKLPGLILYGIAMVPLFTGMESHHYMVSVLPESVVLLAVLKPPIRRKDVPLIVLGAVLWIPALHHLPWIPRLLAGIHSVTDLRHPDLLVLTQLVWVLYLFPRLYRNPYLEEGSNESVATV